LNHECWCGRELRCLLLTSILATETALNFSGPYNTMRPA